MFSVPVGEAPGFPKGRWDRGMFVGYRWLICDEADVNQVLIELDSPPNMFWPAAQYPWGAIDSFARWAEIRPHPKLKPGQTQVAPGEYAHYPKYSILVYYGTDGVQWINGRYVEEALIPTVDTHQIHHESWVWGTDAGDPVYRTQAPFRQFWGWDYVLKFGKLPSLPLVYDRYIGCVNANMIAAYTLGRTFAPETLLFKPPTIRQRFGYIGGYSVDVTIRMGYNPAGWNTWWNPVGQSPVPATLGAYEPIWTSSVAPTAIRSKRIRYYPPVTMIF